MRTIHIMSGIPGSGKSHYIKTNQKTFDQHMSRDYFRALLRNAYFSDDYFPTSANKEWEYWLAHCNASLIRNHMTPHWIDQTTIGVGSLAKLMNGLFIRKQDGCIRDKIVLHIFETPFEVCVERNNQREGNARVPMGVMQSMYEKFQASPLNRVSIHGAGIKFSDEDEIILHKED